MAKALSDEIVASVKDLVQHICGHSQDSEAGRYITERIFQDLKKSDTMFFLNKTDTEKLIENMAAKYSFHGFPQHADTLKSAYNKYITKEDKDSELTAKLNIVKFLLSMSESPTNKFLTHPEEFVPKQETVVQEINWAEFLNEGFEHRIQNYDPSSSSSEDLSVISEELEDTEKETSKDVTVPSIKDSSNSLYKLDLQANREELLLTIQHSWFNQDHFVMEPPSKWEEANIALDWQKYLENEVKGLIHIPKSSVITEYKVIREILWQLFDVHNSSVFQLEGNSLVVNKNITISSVRPETFQTYMVEFLPYIEIMEYFREFKKSMQKDAYEDKNRKPHTYFSYYDALNGIFYPAYFKICTLEDKVREQEETFTLLMLSCELQKILEPIFALKKVHETVMVNFNSSSNSSSVEKVADLLLRLENSLRFSYSKMEHDIKITLYLSSLYYYFCVIDRWLIKGDFSDCQNEFLIEHVEEILEPWEMSFRLRTNIKEKSARIVEDSTNNPVQIEKSFTKDSIFYVIAHDVLEVARNMCLLRKLGKFKLETESQGNILGKKETIYEEFTKRVLEDLFKYYYQFEEGENVTVSKSNQNMEQTVLPFGNDYIYPVIRTNRSNPTEMDKLENLVDINYGFLMKAFEDFFIEKPETENEKPNATLYEKLSKVTKTLFKIQGFYSKIFTKILKERFTISGLMVKTILVEEYNLDKQFDFLRHTFLYFDDFIFPFYRRLFEMLNSGAKNWSNNIWLTSHLQDVIMDTYPEFYESTYVKVETTAKVFQKYSDCLSTINIKSTVNWPLNIIISEKHIGKYEELFQFILKIKWALYTLNHLYFEDVHPKKSSNQMIPPVICNVVMQLKYLRFSLLDMFTSIQHYIFGFVFYKSLKRFELDFEKSSDLKSIMSAHADFINSIHAMCKEVWLINFGELRFDTVIHCVEQINIMWNDLSKADLEKLNECYKSYKMYYSLINNVIHPVYIFDY